MTASPLRSDLRPPSDPAALRRWLDRKEDRLAQIMGDELTLLVQRSVSAFARTLPSLTASGDFAVFDEIPFEWVGIIDARLLPELEAIYLAGGVNVWAAAPAGAIPAQAAQSWASIVNEAAREYLGRRRNFLVGVGDSLFQGVIAQVDRAILTGTSAEEVKVALEQLGNFSEFRADTIARTEINNAYVNGNYQSAQAMGEYGPVEKMWLATSDARTRPSHRDANGTLLPFSEPFLVDGEEMMHPHDDNASAANNVNCRCILLEFWPNDIRPDGSVVGEGEQQRVDPNFLQPLDYVGELM